MVTELKQIIYRYILEKSVSTGKTESDIIRDLLKVDQFHAAYRKWKERNINPVKNTYYTAKEKKKRLDRV